MGEYGKTMDGIRKKYEDSTSWYMDKNSGATYNEFIWGGGDRTYDIAGYGVYCCDCGGQKHH